MLKPDDVITNKYILKQFKWFNFTKVIHRERYSKQMLSAYIAQTERRIRPTLLYSCRYYIVLIILIMLTKLNSLIYNFYLCIINVGTSKWFFYNYCLKIVYVGL